jgi:transcriptional regulator with XRE-family HTH domain
MRPMENPGSPLGEKLRALRIAREWSQATLAKKAGCTQAEISKLELSTNPKTTWRVIHGIEMALGERLFERPIPPALESFLAHQMASQLDPPLTGDEVMLLSSALYDRPGANPSPLEWLDAIRALRRLRS